MNRETRRRLAKAARRGKLADMPRGAAALDALTARHRDHLTRQDHTPRAVAGPRATLRVDFPGKGARNG